MDQKSCTFIGFVVFFAACFIVGAVGAFYTKRLVAHRLERLKQRNLEKFAPFFESALRILFTLLAVLSAYMLANMPKVYQCAFK